VLVLDVKGQTETAAAIAAGCATYRPDVAVAGVILNRVASERHRALIAPAFERIGIRLFGALANDPRLALPERHLGLVQAGETAGVEGRLDLLADVLAESVDLDAVAARAQPSKTAATASDMGFIDPPGQRVALAEDEAFSFMYPHLVEHWRSRGAEILPFSPLHNQAPAAAADAVWLPGGYPELHAGVLASADQFRQGLRTLAERSVPIHGECGGYMVLGQGLEDADGKRHAMTGLLTVETSFARRSLHLGYRAARLSGDCALGRSGAEILGHEFHYASVLAVGDDKLVDCRDAANAVVGEAGARRGSVSGTFFHVISRGQS
jgi:cobyrinic acid a,c-diamide synthase